MRTGTSYTKAFSEMMWLMILLLVVFAAGCDRDHGATAVSLVSIEITPPSPSIVKGTTIQLTATGIYSDNTNRNLTSSVTWSSSDITIATITDAGLATGVGVGVPPITARSGDISATTTLNVTNAALTSIAVTLTNPSIANGTTKQFTATGTYSDNTTQDITSLVTWSSSAGSVATINNAAGSKGLATSVAVGSTTITAISGFIAGTTTLNVTNAALVSITATPTNPSIAQGLTKQFIATGTFSDTTTQDITSLVTWGSSNGSVATISNAAGFNGLATSVAVGSSTITATLGAVSGTTTLTVTNATLSSIAVTPTNPSIAKGLTSQFIATGTFSDTTTQDITSLVTWSSSAGSVATISNAAGSKGLATSVAVGSTTITATLGTVSGTTTLTVTAATLSSIAVTPTNPSIARGLTKQFIATGTFSDTTTQDITLVVTWGSSNGSVATISNAAGSKGLATSVAVGSSTIAATLGAVSGTTTLTVTNATLSSIAITPTNPSIAQGLTNQFIATGTFSDTTTQNITSLVAWSSSNGSVATISNAAGSNGLATSVAVGSSTITGTLGAVSGTTILTVTAATLSSIAITPINPSIAKGLTNQFIATGTFSDATTQDITLVVTWSSSAGSVATISNAAGSKGLATSVAVGSTTITATLGAVSGITTLTVTNATLSSIAVTPINPSIAQGSTNQFIATGTYSDSTTQNITSVVTWISSNGSVATISNAAGFNGLATAVAVGTTTITAIDPTTLILRNTTLTVTAAGLNLRRAASFAVLAGTTLTNAGSTTVTGDVGAAGVTGTAPTVIGNYYPIGSETAYANAIADLPLVISDANDIVLFPCGATISGAIGTVSLTPGVYCISANAAISGVVNLTLNGAGEYIFRTLGALTPAANSTVIFGGSATDVNTRVFWVAGSASLGSPSTTWKGTILSGGAITLGDADTLVKGRVLTTAAVTLSNNTITIP